MWEGSEVVGGRRKSARISALNEVKRNNEFSKSGDNVVGENGQNQAHVTARAAASAAKRGRKRKRLKDVGLSSQQDGEDQEQEDNSIMNDEAENLSSDEQVPQKRIFEFILDTLQRRDVFGIFAQPVDPQQVRSYYSIIKEPMDFGTMRAKLHEGMYNNLEEFEHDAILVSKNAKHFNSSATVYHFQAQRLQELADELFRDLKTDPERFLLENSLKRRCPDRKPQSEARGLCRKHATPGSVKRRKTDSNPGLRDSRNSNLVETQQRQTYWRPSNDDESLFSTVYNAPKSLFHIDAGFGYRESLMRFIKDLGPTAQMVAQRKLESLIEAPNCQSQTTPPVQTPYYPASTLSAPGVPGHPAVVNTSQTTQMQHNSLYNFPRDANVSYFHGDASARRYAPARAGICINEGAYKGNMIVPGTSRLGTESNLNDPKGKMILQVAEGKDTYNKALHEQMAIDINKNMNIPGLTTGIGLQGSNMEGRAPQNQNSKVRLESHIRVVRDLSSPGTSNNSIKFRTVDMLAKPNNLGIQLLQQAQLSMTAYHSNQSRLLEIMSRSNTYLRPSSYMPSPAPKLSSLSQAQTSFNDFGSKLNNNYAASSAQAGHLSQLNNYAASSAQAGQLSSLNNYVANSAQAGQLAQWNHPGTARSMQEIGSFPSMKVKLGEDHGPLANGMFMRKEQELVSSAQGIMKPPLYNEIGTHERATTHQWYQKEPTSPSFISLLEDSQQPNLALQL
ncbi:uncharacterized protein LOC110750774 [Prunus avium]|uniref:Uncharacterized protein LOC110750774 n=1 Tax=Prunus avium TaxID=42229 RepID=A0A6P5RYN6_PRUAV|nr:uncharacterized protein LOC110750774 [Prunus avium]